ncbi:MAG: LptE family protein [Candidatus Omnitrophota bacterium]|nr:LptE family protein [Candidatus Omnitrophota bacterium]
MKKRISRIFLFSVLCFLSSALAGCGYTTRSMVGSKYRTIYITPFVNKINITTQTDAANKYRLYRPMIETDITRSVNNRYLFDGNLRPLKEESADVILKGEVLDFRRDPLRYDANGNVTEYRINLVVNISLWERAENKLIWQENSFTGDTTYFTSSSGNPQAKSEDTAVTDALTDLSRRIVERTVEQW